MCGCRLHPARPPAASARRRRPPFHTFAPNRLALLMGPLVVPGHSCQRKLSHHELKKVKTRVGQTGHYSLGHCLHVPSPCEFHVPQLLPRNYYHRYRPYRQPDPGATTIPLPRLPLHVLLSTHKRSPASSSCHPLPCVLVPHCRHPHSLQPCRTRFPLPSSSLRRSSNRASSRSRLAGTFVTRLGPGRHATSCRSLWWCAFCLRRHLFLLASHPVGSRAVSLCRSLQREAEATIGERGRGEQ